MHSESGRPVQEELGCSLCTSSASQLRGCFVAQIDRWTYHDAMESKADPTRIPERTGISPR